MTITTEMIIELSKWLGAVAIIAGTIRKVTKPVKKVYTAITLMQHERLESAYAIYVEYLGFCPSGEKNALERIYSHYKADGNNSISDKYIDEILSLPTYPKELKLSEVMKMKE